jgi:hypothetical protein
LRGRVGVGVPPHSARVERFPPTAALYKQRASADEHAVDLH